MRNAPDVDEVTAETPGIDTLAPKIGSPAAVLTSPFTNPPVGVIGMLPASVF